MPENNGKSRLSVKSRLSRIQQILKPIEITALGVLRDRAVLSGLITAALTGAGAHLSPHVTHEIADILTVVIAMVLFHLKADPRQPK